MRKEKPKVDKESEVGRFESQCEKDGDLKNKSLGPESNSIIMNGLNF